MQASQVNREREDELEQRQSAAASAPGTEGMPRWQAVKRWLQLAGYRRWLRRRHRTTPAIPPHAMTTLNATGPGGYNPPMAWRKGISR
jgi:hypothetical protein